QRQRSEDRELDVRVGGRSRKQRVDNVIGLAEPERQAKHDALADAGNDRLRNRAGIREDLRHRRDQTVPTGVTGEPTAPVRRNGGAVNMKWLRRALRKCSASSVKYQSSPSGMPRLNRQC